MGNTLPITSFTVVPTTSGTSMVFTITDTGNLLTTTKMIRAVIRDALEQWVSTNRAQLITNGDESFVEHFEKSDQDDSKILDILSFVYSTKVATLATTATTSLTTSDLTATAPFEDV